MKKVITPVLAALLAFSAVVASAATLGGLSTEQLGADDTVVAACDSNGVEIAYSTGYDAGTYAVTAAEISGIDAACVGQELSVTVADGTGVALASGTVTVAGVSETVTFPSAVAANSVESASVLIQG